MCIRDRQYLGGGANGAVKEHFALADQGGGDVGERRQIAAGADRSFGWNAWQDAPVDQFDEAFQEHRAHTGIALRQRIETGNQYRQRGFRAEVLAQTTAVVTGQVQGQFGHQFRWHDDGAGVAIASGDAVNGAAIGEQAFKVCLLYTSRCV